MKTEKEIKDEISRLEDEVKDAYLSHNAEDMVIFKNQVTCLEWVLGLRESTKW